MKSNGWMRWVRRRGWVRDSATRQKVRCWPVVVAVCAWLLLLSVASLALASVRVFDFWVQAAEDRIWVYWETGSEIDNLGFYLWRSEQREMGYQKLPLGSAQQFIPSDDFGIGSAYAFADLQATPGVLYYYKLQDVPVAGSAEMLGPVFAGIGIAPTPLPTLPSTAAPTSMATVAPTVTRTPTVLVPIATSTVTPPVPTPLPLSSTSTPMSASGPTAVASRTPLPPPTATPAVALVAGSTAPAPTLAAPGQQLQIPAPAALGESPRDLTGAAPPRTTPTTFDDVSPTPTARREAGSPLATPQGPTQAPDMPSYEDARTLGVVEGTTLSQTGAVWLWLLGLTGLLLMVAGFVLWKRG